MKVYFEDFRERTKENRGSSHGRDLSSIHNPSLLARLVVLRFKITAILSDSIVCSEQANYIGHDPKCLTKKVSDASFQNPHMMPGIS